MDKKRWVLTAVVVAVAVSILDMVYQGGVLGRMYAATAHMWRTQQQMGEMLPYGLLTTLIASFVLVYIYHRGYEGKGSRIAEGIRFGLIIGLLTAFPMAVWTYVVMPIPLAMAAGWFGIGMLEMLLAGAIIGAMYKRTTP